MSIGFFRTQEGLSSMIRKVGVTQETNNLLSQNYFFIAPSLLKKYFQVSVQ